MVASDRKPLNGQNFANLICKLLTDDRFDQSILGDDENLML